MIFNCVAFLFRFRKLVKYDDWSSVAIHVALDNTVIINEISKCIVDCLIIVAFKFFLEQLCLNAGNSTNLHSQEWTPLLLIVPLRLGLTEINPIYVSGLQVLIKTKNELL